MGPYIYPQIRQSRGIRVLSLSPSRQFSAPLVGVLSEINLPKEHFLDTVVKAAKQAGVPSIDDIAANLPAILDEEDVPVHRMLSQNAYEALSYTWDSREGSLPLLLEGETALITPNCNSALRHLRYVDRPRVLWVDAVCIDQTSPPEKNQQVELMGDIYKFANNLIIWLGSDNIAKSVGEPQGSPREWLTERISPQISRLIFREPAIRSKHVIPCLQSRWFKRAWTVQEQILSSRSNMARVKWGRYGASWSDFETLILPYGTLRTSEALEYGSNYSFYSARQAVGLSYMKSIMEPMISERDQRIAWFVMFLSSRRFDALDGRDRIYAFRSLLMDAGVACLPVDYAADVESVYEDFTRTVTIDQSSLWFILCNSTTDKSLKLPSWVPDWTKTNILDNMLLFQSAGLVFGDFNATRGSPLVATTANSSKARELNLRGKIISTVQWLSRRVPMFDFSSPSWANIEEFTAIFRQLMGQVHRQGRMNDLEALIRSSLRLESDFDPQLQVAMTWSLQCIIPRLQTEKDQELQMRTFRQLYLSFSEDANSSNTPASDRTERTSAYLRLMKGIFQGATFICTTDGKFGYCWGIFQDDEAQHLVNQSQIAEPKYVAALLAGANVPVILAPHNNGYKLVGAAFIQGVMEGENWPENIDPKNLDIITLC